MGQGLARAFCLVSRLGLCPCTYSSSTYSTCSAGSLDYWKTLGVKPQQTNWRAVRTPLAAALPPPANEPTLDLPGGVCGGGERARTGMAEEQWLAPAAPSKKHGRAARHHAQARA